MLKAVPVAGKQKSADICQAFIDGAPRSAKGFVFYGVNDSNVREWRSIVRSGADWFYIDNSFYDCVRGVQFRVAKNRVQVNPSHRTTDGARFAALGLPVLPMRDDRLHLPALMVEQSPDFMRNVAQHPNWLAGYRGRDSILRPWRRDKKAAGLSLAGDLARCGHVITHSSAAAVEALLRGLPITVSPMSACYGWEDREHLFGVLADAQFNLTEMRKGLAWEMLNR